MQEEQLQHQTAGQAEPVHGLVQQAADSGAEHVGLPERRGNDEAQEPEAEHASDGCDRAESPLLHLVNVLPVSLSLPRPGANQSTENRKAAEGDHDQGKDQEAEELDDG